MLTINTLPFLSLRNAEHVSFFNNTVVAITTLGAEDLGLSTAQFTEFKKAVTEEQDIVLKAQGSMYTADMEAADKERDALYGLIHHKLMAVAMYPENSAMATYKTALQKYILNKYNTDIPSLAYQEESAHLSGFDMDMHAQFSDDDLEAMGVSTDLLLLKAANERFAEMYNQRAVERSGSNAEETKRLREQSEALYARIKLYLEYTADSAPESDKGILCAKLIGVINEIVRDARKHLNMRLGKSPVDEEESTDSTPSTDSGNEPGLDDNVSPIPYPKD